MEISPRLDATAKSWDSPLLDFSTWGHKVVGVGCSRFLTRYSDIIFFHLIDGCDIANTRLRVRSFLKAIKRANPSKKKIPVTVELRQWIWTDFSDTTPRRDLQSWGALMIGFLSLRIADIEDLGGNDIVPSLRLRGSRCQSGSVILRLIRKEWVPLGLDSPPVTVSPHSSARIAWFEARRWGPEGNRPLFHGIRFRRRVQNRLV